MRRAIIAAFLAACAAWVLTGPSAGAASSAPRAGIDWPQFRGIRAAGVADEFPVATEWNVETGKAVAWKTPIPGLGHSSPVVWGNLVCLTSAISGRKDADLIGGARPAPRQHQCSLAPLPHRPALSPC